MSAHQQTVPAVLGVLVLLAAAQCMSTGKNGDTTGDHSVTSYSTVVIHHPQGKKSVKDTEEGRSQTYFKVKRLRTSTEQPKIQADFRPSQYFPESDAGELFKTMDSAQVSPNSRQSEYREDKTMLDKELRKIKFKDDDRSSEETNWRQNFRPGGRHQGRKQHSAENSQGHEARKETKQSGEESKEHVELVRHSQRAKNEEKPTLRPKHGDNSAIPQEIPSTYGYEFANAIPAFPVDLTHPFEALHIQEQKLHSIPPPGMSAELIETLLSQQPQTFDTEKIVEPQKKSKSQNFKVGYSIGFGGGDDVVVGKPKDVRLHINGRNSIWKTLTNGVEMSEDVAKKIPLGVKIEDSAVKASDSVLKNDVYYMNNYKLDTTVPTTGRSSFDHAQALTTSNSFDFSNAVDPGWFQHQPVELDMAGLYQTYGYPSPLPVYIPGPKGSGAMVHAIVIPIQSLPGVGWSPEGHSLQTSVGQHQPLQASVGQHQPLQASLGSHTPLQFQTTSHQPLQLQPAPHQSAQISTNSHQPVQFHSNGHQPIQLQAATHQPIQLQAASHQPFHLVPLQFAHVLQMHQPQHQSSLQSVQMPVHLKTQVQQLQPTMHHHQRGRTPKARDSLKQGSLDAAPIIVPPAPSDQAKLQHELNAILADEMKRKNQRHPAVGLRPPLPF